MGPHTLLLLATIGALCEGSGAEQCAADGCFGVFCVCNTPQQDCAHPSVCATLYFYNEAGENITMLQGTRDYKKGLNKKAIKNVASVQQVGKGCYKIYKGKKYNGASLKLEGNSIISLKEAHMDTTIKSVRYNINCDFPKAAGVPWWVILLAVGFVLLLAIGVFLVFRWRQQKQKGDQVPSEDP